jgi:hypothetical protein
MYSVSIPGMPLIFVRPCRTAKRGNAATPNFDGGHFEIADLQVVDLRSAKRCVVPVGKRADIRVGSEEMPSDLKKVSGKL